MTARVRIGINGFGRIGRNLVRAVLRREVSFDIVASTTGAARAIGLVAPELAGRLDGLALRVPVADGSITDLVCTLDPERPLVSSDVIGNPHSCVFSALDTMVGAEHVKVLAWYDNEWGYANRLVDLVELVASAAVVPAVA